MEYGSSSLLWNMEKQIKRSRCRLFSYVMLCYVTTMDHDPKTLLRDCFVEYGKADQKKEMQTVQCKQAEEAYFKSSDRSRLCIVTYL